MLFKHTSCNHRCGVFITLLLQVISRFHEAGKCLCVNKLLNRL